MLNIDSTWRSHQSSVQRGDLWTDSACCKRPLGGRRIRAERSGASHRRKPTRVSRVRDPQLHPHPHPSSPLPLTSVTNPDRPRTYAPGQPPPPPRRPVLAMTVAGPAPCGFRARARARGALAAPPPPSPPRRPADLVDGLAVSRSGGYCAGGRHGHVRGWWAAPGCRRRPPHQWARPHLLLFQPPLPPPPPPHCCQPPIPFQTWEGIGEGGWGDDKDDDDLASCALSPGPPPAVPPPATPLPHRAPRRETSRRGSSWQRGLLLRPRVFRECGWVGGGTGGLWQPESPGRWRLGLCFGRA